MPGIVFVMMKIVISIIQALIGYQYCDVHMRIDRCSIAD